MPTAYPLKPCKHPGCRKYAELGQSYCAEHLALRREKYLAFQRERNKYRGTRTERGYSNKWLSARAAFLTEHPLCVECQRQGIFTPATDVDHIIPHKGDQKLFWDRKNWQALCHSCHSRKTAREDGGFGNKKPLGRV